MDEIKRIQELVEQCNYHSNLYYNQDKPKISDKEYDQLYSELESLEKETGYILSCSPTQKVQGKVLPYLTKVQHTEPMLSAEKSKDINDVIKFMGNELCVLSWKLDGLTIVLRYKEGKLQQAITRGGGYEGEDVTHTVKTFTNVPLTIDYQGYLELRGEGLVPFKDFKRINNELISKGEEPYSSPRNLAAGSVRQLDANITKNRNLIFVAFGIVKCDIEIFLKTKDAQFVFLENQGFTVVDYDLVNQSEIKEFIEKYQSRVPNLPFLTDGLIIEYDDVEYGKAQGSTGHHTKNMFALKWKDDSSETVFRGVELNTTRTGMTSITAIFDEVDIDGAKLSRASLHNYDIFKSLQLGIGDTITVYRANSVIPQIEDNLIRSNTYQIDMHCPSCKGNLVIKTPKEANFLFCENKDCPSKHLDKFVHFVSKDGMNIDGLSEATLEKFIEKGFIQEFSDIYYLDYYTNEIVNMEGFGVKSYNKLITSIEKSLKIKLENFIYALGIEYVGKGTSKRLAKYFNNDIDGFLEAVDNYSELLKIDDLGQVTANSIYKYFTDKKNIAEVAQLLSTIEIIKPKNNDIVSDNPLKGKRVYGTGSFQNYKKEELKSVIESFGCEFVNGYSKSLDYLIVGSIKGSSKEDKARNDGVKIMSEDEFVKIVKEYGGN